MRNQVHEGCVVACAMKRRLGPIFNAANDAVGQAVAKRVSRSWYAARPNLLETATDYIKE
jgi:hypothetical protein